LNAIREAADVSMGQSSDIDEMNVNAVEFLCETIRNLFYNLGDATERIALLESKNAALTMNVQAANNRRRVFGCK
jgi:hypothetical protein